MHLFIKGGKYEPPPEYIDYQLCRYVYHCLPSELDAEPWENVALHLEFMAQEARVNKPKDEKDWGEMAGQIDWAG